MAVAALAATATVSCSAPEQKFVDYDYRLSHPIKVGTKSAGLVLNEPANGMLSDKDRRRLYDFATDFAERGTGMVQVSVEADSPGDAAARAFLGRIVTLLVQDGVPADKVEPQLVINGEVKGPRTVVLTARQYVAELPECGAATGGYEATMANAPSSNFGCSVQRNIGAMVANPRDMIRAREESPAPSVRELREVPGYRANE